MRHWVQTAFHENHWRTGHWIEGARVVTMLRAVRRRVKRLLF